MSERGSEFWIKLCVGLLALLGASIGYSTALTFSNESWTAERALITTAIRTEGDALKEMQSNQHQDELKQQQIEDHLDNVDGRLQATIDELSGMGYAPKTKARQ